MSTTVKCLIVDDEELARALLDNYVKRVPYLENVGMCANPLEAMQVLRSQKVDLIFLDIQMPELTGIEFLKTLPVKPLIIFTTAYKEYALEGFELDVVDYLLKPFRFERFLHAVNKAGKLLEPESPETAAAPSPTREAKPDAKDYLLVKADFKTYRIFYRDILYIESMKEYVAFHTPTGKTLSLGSLKSLEQELPSDQFMRIHKSYIVAKKQVSALEGNMVHIGQVKLPIGSSYRTTVMAELFE
ncbi:LytR/AlgR family response regulator transcription factor [Flavilitoribacter nigricans]|uniref:DNA-binding response regulator n=1 Tax=Flavilitoribacter nigricans (strain ATCC 23147 / DSM 23189 / NBRC 102662 / NCIMB 1420 / SS-2) TaxID=1122177 RepID=A0A2D0N8Z7_FLAN2|nr:LytTR family DNA-binding domain-containing protein [Flavilitoribacter nigricans]PHN04991.1 DNA-binding response regulator [Flavilitoribacter nigricans DSM 23189 = NBRC 102662]